MTNCAATTKDLTNAEQEDQNKSLIKYSLILLAIILVRLLFEFNLFYLKTFGSSYELIKAHGVLYAFWTTYCITYFLYFINIFLFLSLIIFFLTGARYQKIFSYLSTLSPVLLTPIIIDSALSSHFDANYLYATRENFWNNLFFWRFSGDATIGMLVEIALIVIIAFRFVWHETGSLCKGLSAVALFDIGVVAYSTPDLFYSRQESLSSSQFVLIHYLCVNLFLTLLTYMSFSSKAKLASIAINCRGLRYATFFSSFLIGTLINAEITGQYPLERSFSGALVIFFTWQCAVIWNDIADINIDRITNRGRPLVIGVVSATDYRMMSYVLCSWVLLFAANTSLHMLGLAFWALIAAAIYSCPPVRLRKNFSGHLVIGTSIFFSFYAGLSINNVPTSAMVVKAYIVGAYLGLLGTILSLAKDLKDLEGDSREGVANLFTLAGKERGKLLFILLYALVLLSSLFILYKQKLEVVSFVILLAYLYYKREKLSYVYISGIAMAFWCYLGAF